LDRQPAGVVPFLELAQLLARAEDRGRQLGERLRQGPRGEAERRRSADFLQQVGWQDQRTHALAVERSSRAGEGYGGEKQAEDQEAGVLHDGVSSEISSYSTLPLAWTTPRSPARSKRSPISSRSRTRIRSASATIATRCARSRSRRRRSPACSPRGSR